MRPMAGKKRATTLDLFPQGAAAHSSGNAWDEEELRAYYDSRPPICGGVLVKQFLLNGELVSYYEFLGLDETRMLPLPTTELQLSTLATAESGGGRLIIPDLNKASASRGGEIPPSTLIVSDTSVKQNYVGGKDIEEGEIAGDNDNDGAAAAQGHKWKIHKVLTSSDVSTLSRLLLPSDQVVKHVLKYIDEREMTVHGKQVRVWDEDEEVEHTMRLAKWKSSRTYVFKDGWKGKIVDGRKLKIGDEVGFYWDPRDSRFIFSVLTVALH